MTVANGLASKLASFAELGPFMFKELAGVRTLAGNLELTKQSRNIQVLDPGGSHRDVELPAEEVGLFYWVVNSADGAENLVLKNDAGDTEATVAQGEECVIWCDDDASWTVLKRGTVEPAGEGQILTISGTIAAGAVATLNATPVAVIPAPGAGKYIEVISCHWWLDFATSAYDAAAAGDALGLKYTNGSGAQTVDTVAGNVIGSASADHHALVRGALEVNLTSAGNAPVVAHIDTGEWGTGDSPLKYQIHYRIRTLAF